MGIEEEMSQSIVYNLNILTYAVKPSDQLQEFLTDGLFIKSNTNAFIHVTYYLFNILDAKEFRKKFYWPIIDKKSENSYRTNSVDFINMLIDRHNISHEKIKQVTVVHPSGKKFMCLMLDIIKEAIKEVMKRKKISPNQSLDIEKAEKAVETISKIENEIMGSLKAEMKTIKDKTTEIQELINEIYPSDENSVPFEEFIANWHALNKTRLQSMKERDGKVKEIITKSHLLQEKAHRMLSGKKYEIVQPSSNEVKELADFYQHLELPTDQQLNIVSLLLYLESTLSIIQNYIENFSYDEVDISQDEMKVVKRKLVELQHFEPLIKKLSEKENQVKEKITKLRTEREERELLMDQSLQDDDKLLKEVQGREALKALMSPKYSFDTSRSCMNMHMKQNLLAFAENDGSSNHSAAALNQSRLYRHLSEPNLNKSREMGPPLKPQNVQQNKPPSRRRRRDPMQLMEQAISANSQNKLNTSVCGGAIPKYITSTPFSSTMLSPDQIYNPNFSMVSNVSSIGQTPIPTRQSQEISRNLVVPNVHKPYILAEKISWNEIDNIQQSYSITTATENNFPALPKLQLNEETLCNSSSTCENTVCEKENFGSEIGTAVFGKKQTFEEDLFNISDTILVDND